MRAIAYAMNDRILILLLPLLVIKAPGYSSWSFSLSLVSLMQIQWNPDKVNTSGP